RAPFPATAGNTHHRLFMVNRSAGVVNAGDVAFSGRRTTGERRPRSALVLGVDGPLEFTASHPGTPPDSPALGLFVELAKSPTARAAVRAKAAATSRGQIVGRGAALGRGFAGARTRLVHRPGRDLLGDVFLPAASTQAVPNVLVLTLPLWAP